jgi:Skp family chaperone for outer membrane proteins
VKKAYLLLAALAGLGVAVYMAGQVKAQTPAGGASAAAAPARADSPRVAVFNVAKLMKDFQKWQYYAVTMNNERIDAATELLRLKNEMDKMREVAEKETQKEKIEQWVKAIKDKQRQFEDREGFYKTDLDAKASKHLRELFNDVNLAVSGIVERDAYDIVFAYPDATNTQEAESQSYIDLKMRPQSAMPFYVSKRIDITQVMVDTLNTHRKAPGAIPAEKKLNPEIKATAGAAPAAPAATGMK